MQFRLSCALSAALLLPLLAPACAPTVQMNAPQEPIRISMDVRVRVEIEGDLRAALAENRELTGASAKSSSRSSTNGDQGRIGEQRNGYLGVAGGELNNGFEEVVEAINERRESTYEQIAKRHGADRDEVAAVAAEMLIQDSSAGTYVQSDTGDWVQK